MTIDWELLADTDPNAESLGLRVWLPVPGAGDEGKVPAVKATEDGYELVVQSGGGGGVSLGETSTTAYRGDRGKAAYDHSQVITGNPHGTTKADLSLGNVTNDAQLKIASNLSDLASAATARTNLGLVPGTDVQVYDADLAAIAALSPSNDDFIQRKSGAWTNRTPAQVWADLNTAAVTGSGTLKRTSNSTAKNADTVLATDSQLQFTAAANTDYEIRSMLFVTSNATADFKVGLTAPSGATFTCTVLGTGTGSSAIPGNHQQLGTLNATSDEIAAGCTTGGDGVLVEVRGIVEIAGTSGTVGIQWAQNTSTAVDTIVQARSFLHYRKIN